MRLNRHEAATAALPMTTIQQIASLYSQWRPEHSRASRKRKRVAMLDHSGAAAVQFSPLDRGIVSDAIPAFFIGRDSNGFWVAREAKGRTGGLFLLKRSALSFAHASSGPTGCATIYPAEHFELDLENGGNPFALQLAPLMRLATKLSRRCETLLRK
jgi:hypothetical protein